MRADFPAHCCFLPWEHHNNARVEFRFRQGSDAQSAAACLSGCVDAAPAAVAPGQIPARALRRGREARCRCPRCRRGCSATGARASSSRRPRVRTARSPRRHRRSRSADGGSCSRPAARAYGGRARSARGRIARQPQRASVTGVEQCSQVECFMCAVLHPVRAIARFRRREPQAVVSRHTLPAFREQCSKYLWTICIPPDTIFMTSMCRTHVDVETGLATDRFGAWGRNQFETSEVARSSRLVAGRSRRLWRRVGWRRRDLRLVGAAPALRSKSASCR